MGCLRMVQPALQGLACLLSCTLLLLQHVAAVAAQCPDNERGYRIQEAAQDGREGRVPYLFKKQQLPGKCPEETYPSMDCSSPLKWYWNNLCSFQQDVGGGWASYMICDDARQQAIVQYLRDKGVAGFDDLLRFSPCDLWPLIRCAPAPSLLACLPALPGYHWCLK